MTEQSGYLIDENQIDLFEDDDEDTREFYLLEQKIKETDEEQLFNILSRQVEQISSVKLEDDNDVKKADLQQNDRNFILKNEDNNLNKINNEIILRTKKKISFDDNSYENETKNHLFKSEQEIKDFKINRPLTIYIPSTKQDLDLINHLATLGHDVENLRQYVQLTPTMCSGHLWKESYNSGIWIKRYFVFDRSSKLFMYFKSFKNYFKQKEPKDVIPFEDIKNIYPDHIRNIEKIPKYSNFTRKTRSIFIVKTVKRDFVLSTFYPELMRLWIDTIFTGAEAHENFF